MLTTQIKLDNIDIILALFACIAYSQSDGFLFRGDKEQQEVLKKSVGQVYVSDDCFSQAGCNCLQEWEFQGRTIDACSNPDQDRFGSWCQIDETSCDKPDYQFLDTLMYYGYCTCQDISAQPGDPIEPSSPLTSIFTVPSIAPSTEPPLPEPFPSLQFTPVKVPAQASAPPTPFSSSLSPIETPSLQITSGDCLTIINGGCQDDEFYMSFADGQPLQSREYLGYDYWQSSGWWMLSKEVGDYTRWCSPTGYIGLYIQKGGLDDDLGSDIITMYSVDSDIQCMDTNNQFDFLTYKLSLKDYKDGHYGAPNPDYFFVVKGTQQRNTQCEALGGKQRMYQIIPTNTTLFVGQNCDFEDL
eukprot:TRINITY_DN21872_c1_g1_i3.p1 TRINITY_DN21872_c1_g1~~TRINITY_DN21872_c1_g1_i3.p1  ORF type:complete len:356 (-),score=27.86 TRINITY_DN21872_c1_g1_i3:128-1195(-)